MAIPVTSRGNFQYLGNKDKKEVHDLNNENNNCQINEIFKAGHAVKFVPDLLSLAHIEGYDNCAYCIGGSQR